jgi:hypothetical protein
VHPAADTTRCARDGGFSVQKEVGEDVDLQVPHAARVACGLQACGEADGAVFDGVDFDGGSEQGEVRHPIRRRIDIDAPGCDGLLGAFDRCGGLGEFDLVAGPLL